MLLCSVGANLLAHSCSHKQGKQKINVSHDLCIVEKNNEDKKE